MDQIIITSGEKFTDIDTLASSLAYSELLTKLGKDNTVVLPGPLNESITKSIKEWNLNYLSKLGNGEFSFVLIDISEKEFFSHFVKEDKIIEIYDHHFGFDKYWREKLKNDAHIEPVGSCATLIWEEYGKRKIEISTLNANLLYTAIFSNTLNFNSSVTTNRDREAFQNLLTYINLPDNWIETYYKESENEIFKNPINAIAHDIKTVKYGEGKEVTI